MNTNWVARGDTHRELSDVISDLAGCSVNELLRPTDTDAGEIENMTEAAERIRQAINDGEDIHIFGDYDADGVSSVAILYLLITYLKEKAGTKDSGVVNIRVPKRMSEGYGLSEAAIDEFDKGLLVTVDNGITALAAVKKARDKGLFVIVLDHHLPAEEGLPSANIIVDPHVHPDKNGYEEFCGAGLSFKLAKYFLTESEEKDLLDKLCAVATVGTVADQMPLTGANRVIVEDGLGFMNEKKMTQGLKSLIEACEFTKINEVDVGFKIAPILNAAGRMLDDGGKYAAGCLAQDNKPTPTLVKKLIEINENRKALVDETLKSVQEQIGENPAFPIVAHVPQLHPGIVGIVAGKIMEQYHCPVYLFTGEGNLGGSARSQIPNFNLHEFTASHSSLLISFGGHCNAVGLQIKEENLEKFREAVQRDFHEMDIQVDDNIYYDIELKPDQILGCIGEQEKFGPFGAGVPKPTVLVRNVPCVTGKGGQHYARMGADKRHVKMFGRGYILLAWNMGDKYEEMGKPRNVDVIGTLNLSDSKYGRQMQFMVTDFTPAS